MIGYGRRTVKTGLVAVVGMLLAVSAGVALAAPAVTAVSEKAVRLEAGGKPVTLTLQGTDLDQVQSAAVLLAGQPVKEVTVKLGAATPGAKSRAVTLAAQAAAKPGKDYKLQLTAGKLSIPVAATLEVVAPATAAAPAPAAKPVPQPSPVPTTQPAAKEPAPKVAVVKPSTPTTPAPGSAAPSTIGPQAGLAPKVSAPAPPPETKPMTPAKPLAPPVAIGPKTPILVPRAPLKISPPPQVFGVQRTPDGYALTGRGFGTDKARLQVFEGLTPVRPDAILSVADNRVVVRSNASGMVQHRVVAAGQQSNPFPFFHPQAPRAVGSVGVSREELSKILASPRVRALTPGGTVQPGLPGLPRVAAPGQTSPSSPTAQRPAPRAGSFSPKVIPKAGELTMTGLGE